MRLNGTTKVASLLPVPQAAPLVATAAWPVRSGLVPPLADRFSPRPETAPDLQLLLAGNAAVALTSPSVTSEARSGHDWAGCTGKTQLAASYAEAQWRERALDLLVWVDGSSSASMLSGYVAAAGALTGSQVPGGAESVAASFLSWLARTDRRWLVVLDDVADSSELEGWWPAGPAGRVIVTTRQDQELAGLQDVPAVEVGPFSRREAMSYLVGRLSDHPDQRRGVIDLLQYLDCQPPALAHATAVIASSWMTSTDYQEQFSQRSRALSAPGTPSPAAAGVTWTLCLDQAEQMMRGGSAGSCLALAALLDGHGIPAAIFAAAAACRYLTGDTTQEAREQVQLTLTVLDQVGLISLDRASEPPLVRMDLALQQAVRSALPPETLDQAWRAAAAALVESWPSPEPGPLIGQGLRSAAVALRRATGTRLLADGCHPLLLRAGQSLADASLTGPAVEYWSELTTVAGETFGPGSPECLVTTDWLAAAFVSAGRVSEAVACYQREIVDCGRTYGPDDPRTLAVRLRLGRLLVTVRLFDEAVMVLTSAIGDLERARGLGARTPDPAEARRLLAEAHQGGGGRRARAAFAAAHSRSGRLARFGRNGSH